MQNRLLDIGESVSTYKILKVLRVQDASVSYQAMDSRVGRQVCLEIFTAADEAALKRLNNYFQALAGVQHPNISLVYQTEFLDESLLVASEFVPGGWLADLIEGRPVEIDFVLSCGVQIASALEAVHHKGVVHGDIHPANILVNPPKLRLIGWGLLPGLGQAIKACDADCTYQSPEQADGILIDARSDLFSFGAVLYALATGIPPFRSETVQLPPSELLRSQPPRPTSLSPNCPVELERIIKKAMTRDRDARYQQASEMRLELEQLQDQLKKSSLLEATVKAKRFGDLGRGEQISAPRADDSPSKVESGSQEAPEPLTVHAQPRRLRWLVWPGTASLLVFAALFLMFERRNASTPSRGNTRGTTLLNAEAGSDVIAGKNYALLFATNDYRYWPHLNNPQGDAKAIAEELGKNYDFSDPEPRLVIDPETKDIINVLHQYARRSYGPNDQLFIYFAGHGFFDEHEGEGFLVAKDSKLEQDDAEHTTYLDFSRLSKILNNIPARHIFVVLDVCYGGAFDERVTKWAGQRGADEYADVAPEKFIRRKLAVEGRLYLTSGAITSVPDGRPGGYSPFARRFIELLRGYGGSKQLVTATSIATGVAKLEPEPRFGDFGDSAPGADFLFIPK